MQRPLLVTTPQHSDNTMGSLSVVLQKLTETMMKLWASMTTKTQEEEEKSSPELRPARKYGYICGINSAGEETCYSLEPLRESFGAERISTDQMSLER
jgi:hypothetical protein